MTTIFSQNSESPPMDEAQLVRQALQDAEAFAELYRQHATRVYRYCLAHTGNQKDAEDLTSQTFIAALEGLASFRGGGSFAAWILGIASRKRLMLYRGSRREVALEAALQYPSSALPTDKAAQARIQMEAVARALKQITPERAEAISLHYFGGLTHTEAARILNKTEAAVKMLISRGLNDLRTHTSLALELEP